MSLKDDELERIKHIYVNRIDPSGEMSKLIAERDTLKLENTKLMAENTKLMRQIQAPPPKNTSAAVIEGLQANLAKVNKDLREIKEERDKRREALRRLVKQRDELAKELAEMREKAPKPAPREGPTRVRRSKRR